MYHLTKPQKLVYDMEKFSGGTIAVICGSILFVGRKELEEMIIGGDGESKEEYVKSYRLSSYIFTGEEGKEKGK